MKKASEIKFGIEIECNIPNEYSADFPKGRYHHGIQIPVAPHGWNTQSDGSISAPAGYFGAEIVSPVLSGEDGLVQVVQVLDLLDQIGARTNPSCGLHVHFSTDHLSHAEYIRMIKFFKYFEKAFYALNGHMTINRIHNHYCKPSWLWDGSRYASLNLQHISEGHAEIRVWAGNLKPEVVVSAIYMACALASRATNPELLKCSDTDGMDYREIMRAFVERFLATDEAVNPSMIIPDQNPDDLIEMMLDQSFLA